MDDAAFDRLAAHVGRHVHRRALAGLVVASGLGLPAAGSAKRKKKCKPPKRKCGKRCVTVLTDAANCGSCGRACAAGEVCSGGACQIPCPAGQKACAGRCIPATGCCTNAECTGGDRCTVAACIDDTCRVLSKEEGTSCTTFSGNGGECRGPNCIGCLGRRSNCTSNLDCCGTTSNGIICSSNQHGTSIACQDDSPRCCGFAGSTCASQCDCCQGSDCFRGTCCRAIGSACGNNAHCCSGNCASSVCA